MKVSFAAVLSLFFAATVPSAAITTASATSTTSSTLESAQDSPGHDGSVMAAKSLPLIITSGKKDAAAGVGMSSLRGGRQHRNLDGIFDDDISHHCPTEEGFDIVGDKCYYSCPLYYTRVGVDCYKNCPEGLYSPSGQYNCIQNRYGRGMYLWNFDDPPFKSDGQWTRCKAHNGPDGCEAYGPVVYAKCREGWKLAAPFDCEPFDALCPNEGLEYPYDPTDDLKSKDRRICARPKIAGERFSRTR